MESGNNPNAITMSGSEPLIVFIISEELKSRRFFNALAELGLDNAYYQPHLDEAILACLGITDHSNATLDFYFTVMTEHAEKIDIKEEASTPFGCAQDRPLSLTSQVLEQAKVVYEKLIAFRANMQKH